MATQTCMRYGNLPGLPTSRQWHSDWNRDAIAGFAASDPFGHTVILKNPPRNASPRRAVLLRSGCAHASRMPGGAVNTARVQCSASLSRSF